MNIDTRPMKWQKIRPLLNQENFILGHNIVDVVSIFKDAIASTFT